MKVEVIISVPELKMSFSREMDLSLVFVGHIIALSGLGCLVINETMESNFDGEGKSGQLIAFVSMEKEIKEAYLAGGAKKAINMFANFKFVAN
ncbi:MAG: hypothetical protein WCK59_02940 [Candidatus Falkowbacteria bacterium]